MKVSIKYFNNAINSINFVPTWEDKEVRQIKLGYQTYYICNICGRLSFRKIKLNHNVYCQKHYNQMKRYGHPLDNNPRTIFDKNEIHINGPISIMDLYDTHGNKIGETLFDTEDIEKVRYTKWKLSNHGYACNTPHKYYGPNKYFHRNVLGVDTFVDHINHNTLDNRKSNLRVVTKSQNQMNNNYRGVTTRQDGRYMAHIKKNQKMLNLGIYMYEVEALFARWYAEQLVFGEYASPKERPQLSEDRERQIMEYVERKVQRL